MIELAIKELKKIRKGTDACDCGVVTEFGHIDLHVDNALSYLRDLDWVECGECGMSFYVSRETQGPLYCPKCAQMVQP